MTVDPKKLMNEWAKKNTATPMEPKTTAIHPAFNRGRLFACSSSLVRNFQPCRLVAWQNCWKQPEDVDIVGTSPLSLPPISHIDSNVSSDSLMMGQCGIIAIGGEEALCSLTHSRDLGMVLVGRASPGGLNLSCLGKTWQITFAMANRLEN